MQVRRANEKDIPRFIKCYTEVWKSFQGILPDDYVNNTIEDTQKQSFKDYIKSLLTNPVGVLLVAEEEGEIIGHAQGRLNKGGYGWLGFMGVAPSHRRKGIGKALLTAFIEESKKHECTKVSLDTAPCLKPAIKLYTDFGFVPEGYMRNHMHGLDLIFYSYFL
jgi:ribosomal protein S18 acetylase RimI-like enzyme